MYEDIVVRVSLFISMHIRTFLSTVFFRERDTLLMAVKGSTTCTVLSDCSEGVSLLLGWSPTWPLWNLEHSYIDSKMHVKFKPCFYLYFVVLFAKSAQFQ